MFNNHEDVIGIVEDGLRIAYCYGDNGRYTESIVAAQKIAKEVQQRLEYMQSQIDELQKKLISAEKSDVKMFIDWKRTHYSDRTCAVLCRKVGDVVEIIDTQFAPD